MSSKEMFEELGYSISSEWVCGIEIYTEHLITKYADFEGQIWSNTVTIDLCNGVHSDKYIPIKLLKAINKKIEEFEIVIKARFLEDVAGAINNSDKGRNSMGCSEANYDIYYMIGRALDKEELESLTEREIVLLMKLASYARDVFY